MKKTCTILGSLFLAACSGAVAPAGPHEGDALTAPASVVPAPKPAPPIPHVDVTDAKKAASVLAAFEAVLTAESLPTDKAGLGYEASALSCRDLWVPVAPMGYSCSIQYRIGDAGAFTDIELTAPSQVSENLFDALGTAGATNRVDPAHGAFTSLKNAKLESTALHFDDLSNYQAPPTPTVTVTGARAHGVLDALEAAGIDDKDGTLFLICNKLDPSGAPACSYQLHDAVGPNLDATTSRHLWQSIVAAAAASSFTPINGTLDQMTILNASDFTFDGTTLALVLTGDNATPPPAPTPSR